MLRILTLVFAFALLALSSQSAQAYCIYNYTDGFDVRIQQTAGGNFSDGLSTNGSKACCPWDSMACNITLQRTSVMSMAVIGVKNDTTPEGVPGGIRGQCGTTNSMIEVEAGGWIEVYSGSQRVGGNESQRVFHCIAYGVNGQVTSVVSQ